MHSPTNLSSPRLRIDIQALRGFAVLVVLFYHAKISLFPAGYLGVDVFFVISGFLITRLIKDGIESGTFRLLDFYFRRAKRLLPAAYVTFLVTALLAPLFLTGSEMEDFWKQMVGAVTFTANIVLWRQSAYFSGAAGLKPLLHVWSLAVEEQYYFVLPGMLAFVPRRFWLRGSVILLLASLAMCLGMSGRQFTFYLLPTRAWELMIGSVGALILPGELGQVLKIAFWPALLALLALPMVQFGAYYPGPQALLACLATIIVILRKHPLMLKGAAMHGLSKIGDMSYSLYLVHWPLFAFLDNVWIGETGNQLPASIRLELMVLSLFLAHLLNRYVEEPFRRSAIKRSARVVVSTVATSLSLLLATAGIVHATDTTDYAYRRRGNEGFGVACEFAKDFEPISECRNSDKPEMLIWGDSYAMALVPGILGTVGKAPRIVQATRSLCGPLLELAPTNRTQYGRTWAENCISFNDSVVSYLKRADSIKVVVLSSAFFQFVDKEGQLLKRDSSGGYSMIGAGLTEAVEGLKKTVDTVRAMGKRVVVIAPPPVGGFDIGRCTERVVRNFWVLGGNEECRVNMDAYHKEARDVLDFLDVLPKIAGVEVIRLDNYLCQSGWCRTYINGTFIYSDGGHLSHEGSIFVANAMSLVGQINSAAR